MKTVLSISLMIIFSAGLIFAQQKPIKSKQRDYVPNEEVAIKIAEAVWLPVYGDKIYGSKPFVAKLKDSSVWVVRGTLPSYYEFGGVPYIEIQKKDCKILKVTHGK